MCIMQSENTRMDKEPTNMYRTNKITLAVQELSGIYWEAWHKIG